MAKYRVLEKNLITNEWNDRGFVEAGSQNAAIKQISNGAEGTYAAVPSTSWHPVNVQRVEVLRWVTSDASEEGDAEEAETADPEAGE